MAEAAAIMSLIASGTIQLKDPCNSPGCRVSPRFECPSCKSKYCPQHASETDFKCKLCQSRLTPTQSITI